MRRLSLEELYSEIREISGSANANPRLDMLMEEIREDLKRETAIKEGSPVLELHKWWERYRGLSTYIYR